MPPLPFWAAGASLRLDYLFISRSSAGEKSSPHGCSIFDGDPESQIA
jgi:hypothetical protein